MFARRDSRLSTIGGHRRCFKGPVPRAKTHAPPHATMSVSRHGRMARGEAMGTGSLELSNRLGRLLSSETPASIATHPAALDFLHGRIDYERFRTMPYGRQELKLGRMRGLLRRLGDPHRDVPAVHVAGTKGKGSTARMMGSVLSEAGYRTGVFTSPHLERVEERIAIDGQPCSPDELVQLVERVRPLVLAMDAEAARRDPPQAGPTYFEI